MPAAPARGVLVLALVAVCGAIRARLQNQTTPGTASALAGGNRSVTRWGFVEEGSFIEAEDLVASISPGGAWLASRRDGAEALSLAQTKVRYESQYGFYLHVHRDGPATIHLVRDLRRVYPTEPVYIMSDGGSNYSKLCEEVGNCQFKWKPGANDRWNPMPFFIRMQEAARLLKSKFVIMLEPDNEVRGGIRADPPFAAGGLNDYSNRPFTREMMDYVEKMGRACTGNASFAMKWDHFGLAGGSYFSAAAILDAFDPDTIDWRMLFHLDGKHMFSSDVAMPLAFAVHGYTYYPWEEITQTRFGLQDKAAFRHYGRDEVKPHYGEALSKEDEHLVTNEVPAQKDLNCQGCVWVHSDDECLAQTPFQCPITQQDGGPPDSWKPVVKAPCVK